MGKRAKLSSSSRKKAKRTPIPAGKRASKTGVAQSPKIRVDPLKEYQEAIRTDGVMEVVSLGQECLASVKRHFSTQSLALDRLLNGYGMPGGRIMEIYGPPHIGKSTVLDHLFAQAQKDGGVAILADTETARDKCYTANIGVDIGKLQYLEFDRNEMHIENVMTKIMETAEFWVNKYPDMPVLIGWDALGGTATQDELEKKLDRKAQPALAANIMRKACRQLPPKLGGTNVALVICNHEYENIQMGGFVGKKRETYGGQALRLATSLRLELFNLGFIKDSAGNIVGRKVGAKLVKNRLGHYGQTEFALIAGVGVDNLWSVYERLKELKYIVTSGSWSALNFGGTIYKFQGYSGFAAKCAGDTELYPALVEFYKASW